MNDQKFNSGVAAPFFGHDCARTAPATDAPGDPFRHGAAADVGAAHQGRAVPGGGARSHRPADTGDRTADIEAGVRMINAFMEDRIRERPEEWFWVHRRWPNEVYADLAERERAAKLDFQRGARRVGLARRRNGPV
jgi:KDO2-lipid IV(A) lauroyltransferase